MSSTRIIGVDCATSPGKVGLAVGDVIGGKAHIRYVNDGRREDPADSITGWLAESERALLAMDSPLGWPSPMGFNLSKHKAGEVIDVEPSRFFRRATDAAVERLLGRRPLEVGANWIARTAMAALSLLGKLRELSGQPIPLVWDPEFKDSIAAIEVYPAATLDSYKLPSSGYKGREDKHRRQRQRIILGLRDHLVLPDDTSLLEANDDTLDAVVCVLAGLDFMSGRAFPPENLELARKEGWIWVKRPTV